MPPSFGRRADLERRLPPHWRQLPRLLASARCTRGAFQGERGERPLEGASSNAVGACMLARQESNSRGIGHLDGDACGWQPLLALDWKNADRGRGPFFHPTGERRHSPRCAHSQAPDDHWNADRVPAVYLHAKQARSSGHSVSLPRGLSSWRPAGSQSRLGAPATSSEASYP